MKRLSRLLTKLLVVVVFISGEFSYASWPFLQVVSKDIQNHMRIHLWEYLTNAESDPFMNGDTVRMNAKDNNVLADFSVRRNEVGDSYELRLVVGRFRAEGYETSSDFLTEKTWARLPEERTDAKSISDKIIKEISATIISQSLKADTVAKIRKDKSGTIVAIWNEWVIDVPSTKKDSVVHLIGQYFSMTPKSEVISLWKR